MPRTHTVPGREREREREVNPGGTTHNSTLQNYPRHLAGEPIWARKGVNPARQSTAAFDTCRYVAHSLLYTEKLLA